MASMFREIPLKMKKNSGVNPNLHQKAGAPERLAAELDCLDLLNETIRTRIAKVPIHIMGAACLS